jgi:hypothetical protein
VRVVRAIAAVLLVLIAALLIGRAPDVSTVLDLVTILVRAALQHLRGL